MNAAKITISLNQDLLRRLDRLVQSSAYRSRSEAVQAAVEEKIARQHRSRLAEQCSKLDPVEEQALADLGLEADVGRWPQY